MIKAVLLLLCACAPAFAGGVRSSSGNNFDSVAPAVAAAPTGMTRYLRLSGIVRLREGEDALKELEDAFAAPLRSGKPAALFSYAMQVDGAGQLSMNLIAEPRDLSQVPAFEAYLERLQRQGYRGLPVRFQGIRGLRLDLSLQVGLYAENDDAFEMKAETGMSFGYPTIAEWLAAYDGRFARGITAKRHEDFEEFVRSFPSDPEEYRRIKSLLPDSDVARLSTLTSVDLPEGRRAGPMMDTGPFMPFVFTRACYSPRYEHGMCSTRGGINR